MRDASKIGQDRGTQDPNDAVKQDTGTYEDAAEKLSEEEKFLTRAFPAAPDKNPFKSFR